MCVFSFVFSTRLIRVLAASEKSKTRERRKSKGKKKGEGRRRRKEKRREKEKSLIKNGKSSSSLLPYLLVVEVQDQDLLEGAGDHLVDDVGLRRRGEELCFFC